MDQLFLRIDGCAVGISSDDIDGKGALTASCSRWISIAYGGPAEPLYFNFDESVAYWANVFRNQCRNIIFLYFQDVVMQIGVPKGTTQGCLTPTVHHVKSV